LVNIISGDVRSGLAMTSDGGAGLKLLSLKRLCRERQMMYHKHAIACFVFFSIITIRCVKPFVTCAHLAYLVALLKVVKLTVSSALDLQRRGRAS
jgi:hypothetical protein